VVSDPLGTSVNPDAGDSAVKRGGKPDLESSPEVFTCSRTFNGAESRSGGNALFIASAAFTEDIVCREHRFGTDARAFDLFDCKFPMKCHRMS